MSNKILNDPEFAEIIEESEKEIDSKTKEARSREELIIKNINLNMSLSVYEFKCKGLEYEVEQLKEKLNERNNNGAKQHR